MSEPLLLTNTNGPIATIRLNRPRQRNALSLELMRELIRAFESIGASREIAVVILSGNGPAFSAGHDLSEMIGRDMSAYREIFDVCTDLMTTLQRIPQPVIAEVDGIATAAGCQLVAACDLGIASDLSQFATPGVKIGLFCSTPMVPLTRAIGRKRALEMLLTGKAIDTATACDWGLINRVVPRDQLTACGRIPCFQAARSSGVASGAP
ncbi:MAG: enoyl-CoA hydratase-related protein, partial [Acidobacteria bacterium]|nr:enoyl-CoA hydratase-related protein [Acidobacteriota bacterium]